MTDELAKAYEMIAKLQEELNTLAPVVHLAATISHDTAANLDDGVQKNAPASVAIQEFMLRAQYRLYDAARDALRATGRIS